MSNNEGIRHRIRELRDFATRKGVMKYEERILFEPLLTDVGMMSEIYDMVFALDLDIYAKRSIFYFVVIYYYSPRKLIGIKCPKNVFARMRELVGESSSLVAHGCNNIAYWYLLNNKYHPYVDSVMNRINAMIDEKTK